MRFTHLDIDLHLPKLKAKMINGKRFYFHPDGGRYPSITTVLADYKKEVIKAWRKRVGTKKADNISKAATSRGESFHSLVEMYLKNEDITEALKNTKSGHRLTFNQAKPVINKHINNIHCQETPLLSKVLGIAGRVDLIAEWDGVLSVIDFKGSNRTKREEWIDNYKLQATGYSFMYYEMTKMLPKQIVLVVSCDDFSVQIFKDNPGNWIYKLKNQIKIFNHNLSHPYL